MSKNKGFSLIEVLAVVLTLAILIPLFMRQTPDATRRNSRRTQCGENLKYLGLAAQIFATDHNDEFPGAKLYPAYLKGEAVSAVELYQSISNELASPKVLACPSDQARVAATNFKALEANNISYFGSLSAHEKSLQMFLFGDRNLTVNGQAATAGGATMITENSRLGWTHALHDGEGNVAMSDGSVAKLGRVAKLSPEPHEKPGVTNVLLFP